MVTRNVVVKLKEGLHARPCLAIVKALQGLESKFGIRYEGQTVNGRDMLQLMTLAASESAEIELFAEGCDAELALDVVTEIVEGKDD